MTFITLFRLYSELERDEFENRNSYNKQEDGDGYEKIKS